MIFSMESGQVWQNQILCKTDLCSSHWKISEARLLPRLNWYPEICWRADYSAMASPSVRVSYIMWFELTLRVMHFLKSRLVGTSCPCASGSTYDLPQVNPGLCLYSLFILVTGNRRRVTATVNMDPLFDWPSWSDQCSFLWPTTITKWPMFCIVMSCNLLF